MFLFAHSAPALVLPPADGTPIRHLQRALTQDGKTCFAMARGPGWGTLGETLPADWLAQRGAALGVCASAGRVVVAACGNEGRLEAVNSYDNCFLSFGMMQWTAGPDDQPGELPGLLVALQQRAPDAFAECFGRYELAAEITQESGSLPAVGRLRLNGATLATPAAKAILRSILWAYRFWRAGHHPALRDTQLSLAAARLELARNHTVRDRPVADWLSSEHGMALLLDEHLNRPGHVPATLASAVGQVLAEGAAADPAEWGDAEESRLLAAYETAREATSMTGARQRGNEIAEIVRRGALSDRRGSFGTQAG